MNKEKIKKAASDQYQMILLFIVCLLQNVFITNITWRLEIERSANSTLEIMWKRAGVA
jgi:hypothetical protein